MLESFHQIGKTITRLIKLAEECGMDMREEKEKFLEAVPNCKWCDKKLWQDNCELSENNEFCSQNCCENFLENLHQNQARDSD